MTAAIATTIEAAARIMDGTQRIVTLADAPIHDWNVDDGWLGGPLAIVADSHLYGTVTVDDALPIHEWSDDPDTSKGSHIDHDEPGENGLHRWWVEGDSWAGTCISDQLPFADFTPGRWALILSDPQPADPIPCKGRQGVFELPADIAEATK